MATINKRHVTVLGPVKMEVINLTDVDDAETVSTLIANPSFGFAVNNDDGSDGNNTNVSISGKTITLNNSSLSSSEVTLLVFGF